MSETIELILDSQERVAHVLGIDARTFGRWLKKGCPGLPRRYVLREIILWCRENVWAEDEIPGLLGVDADVKTQYLKERIAKLQRENQLADLKISERSGSLVDFEEVQRLLNALAGTVRNGLERLERKFGKEAADMVADLMDEAESVVLPSEPGEST